MRSRVSGVTARAVTPAVGHGSRVGRDRLGLLAFVAPATVFVAIFYLYPIAYNAVMSVQRFTAASFVTGEAPFVGLGNFSTLLSRSDFWTIAVNTVVFTVGSIVFQF